MAYSGVLNDIRKCVNMEVPERQPVFLCSEEFDVRMAGSTYEKFCADATEMARVMIESVKRFDYDWAWLQVDDCIEFETLGIGVRGEGNILRATTEYLPITGESIDKLEAHGYREEGRMVAFLEAIKRVKDALGDTVCVVGRTAAPYSSVTLAFGISDTSMLIYDDPELLRRSLDFFTDYQTRFGLAQLTAGADAIWFGDCNASGHLISLDAYKQFAAPWAKKCSDAYTGAGGLVYYHASEEKLPYIDAMADLGFSALSCGPGVEITAARQTAAGRVCLMGNVDPIGILMNGTVEQVRKEVERQVRAVCAGGGHLLNSGEMVPRDCPEANIRAMVQTARRVWAEVKG